ncbi:hypothetical protein BJF81_10900 [Ornithinimicrobium sp. CNJ-824]|uniref:hypothetical protein n=1 Tax=Ornithinimicrobium sp. CNJ-824 TaxID=1904966 RepID=UPI000960F940|nr:hypothetical protein [Ornithinimicrobium sp. CNJ-824]OLT23419.1 hypothetical protein BJF81_10900 [Ornithinimicrobium sp. CNJ-824]
MSTRTLRGLAAGAGAAAVLFSGAAGASAIPGQPQADFWEDYFQNENYTDVSCHVSTQEGGFDASDIGIYEDDGWGQLLEDGNEWIAVVLKVAEDYQVLNWDGYGDYAYSDEFPGASPGNVTHAIVCQADAMDDDDDDDDNGVTPGDGDETDEPTETEDPTDDGDDKDKDKDKPTGPPVETDGPATPSGPNMGLMGGAALLLGGAGAAGWAMRRRAGEH